MKNAIRIYGSLALVISLGAAPGLVVRVEAAGAEDGMATPLDLVRSAVERLGGMSRSEASGDTDRDRAEIRRVTETLFDFEAMSRRMLARNWSSGTPSQQAEFVRLLPRLLARIQIDVVGNGAWAATTYDGESMEGRYAQVTSRVVLDRGSDVSIQYRLFKTGDRWAVYDVVQDGVSLVASYRSQFNSILRTSSFAQLLERMRSKETPDAAAADRIQDIGRRLMLLSMVTERGHR